jgi:hypothetical protein
MLNAIAVSKQTPLTKTQRKDSRCHLQVVIFPNQSRFYISNHEFPFYFAEGDLAVFNQQFIDILDKLRLDVQQKGIDLNHYQHDYLSQLRDLGKAAYNKILTPEISQYFKDKDKTEQKRGLSLTFQTPPTFSFFWEMLYAGKPFGVEKDEFWGFHYPIGRTYWGTMEFPDRIQLQEGIFSAIHNKLKHSQEEVERIQQCLHKAGEILKLSLICQLLDRLESKSFCIDNLLELFHDENFRYGMIHFACHCFNPLQTNSDKAYLSLTVQDDHLEIELQKLLAWAEYGFQNHPFVFLNACESGIPGKLLQTSSFPTEMLNFGAGGVIATACTIPDNFASAFASKFYEFLFAQLASDTRVNLGEVLLETRRFFLEQYNNPLGLAYGLYALSNQQLRLMD